MYMMMSIFKHFSRVPFYDTISLAAMIIDLVLKLCPKTKITLLVKSENDRKFGFFKEIQVFYRKILVGIAKIRDGQIY